MITELPTPADFLTGECLPADLRPELVGLRYCLRHHDYIQPDESTCNRKGESK